MAFIGNTNTTQAFTPAVDFFSGNASTTAFTLSRPVASVAQVQAVVNNVAQNPSDAFTVSGNTITFTSAPSSGTNNIYVYYTSPITQVIAPGQGTVGTTSLSSSLLVPPAMVSDQNNSSTGYFDLPVGTTAQRPGSPVVGMMRYNTTESKYEVYTSAGWAFLRSTAYSYNITYLIVAGGGSGGNGLGSSTYASAGGGAGGLLSGTTTLAGGTIYSFVVGAGGVTPSVGSNSTGFSLTSIGGGCGVPVGATSKNGGSGGGGGDGVATGGDTTGGTGTSGQGNNGGNSSGSAGQSAGGGGAGAAGSGTQGGAGAASSITGSSVTYAGGGSGTTGSTVTGGAGGGGNGGTLGNSTAGTANTGGGGGGTQAGNSTDQKGKNGGSGVVILSVPTANYSGTTTGSPTVTTSGSNTILTFTGSGSYTA
jgi:hypothetical protein